MFIVPHAAARATKGEPPPWNLAQADLIEDLRRNRFDTHTPTHREAVSLAQRLAYTARRLVVIQSIDVADVTVTQYGRSPSPGVVGLVMTVYGAPVDHPTDRISGLALVLLLSAGTTR